MNADKTFALALAAVAALSLALPACAQPAQTPAPGQDASGQPAQTPSGGYGRRGGGRGFDHPITLAEYQARSRDRTLRADTDHDGRVSLAEWTAYQAERREASGDEGGHRQGREFGGDPAEQFQMMDANHDGYVTPAEVDAASAARFARMDANHDGVITPDERRAMRGGGEQTQQTPAPQ